jgi:molybdate transport system permease protein
MSETTSPSRIIGSPTTVARAPHRVGSDVPFYVCLVILSGTYVILLAAMLIADAAYLVTADVGEMAQVGPDWLQRVPILRKLANNAMVAALAKPEIQYSIKLSLVSCTITAILSLWVAVPVGYLLSRYRFPGRNFIDAMLDVPIVLPPLVVGLSLLILFQFWPFRISSDWVVYQIPAVILAQFMVACAFAVRTMRATMDQIDPRCEQVALTLGCTRARAFSAVVLPEARRGMLTAGTLAWSRSLGEFGPLLVFAGATRYKTEVLSTTVFLELSIGDLEAAVAVSMIMVLAAVSVLMVARAWGTRDLAL